MRIALAMLAYNRPFHTGLSLAYALANKHADTDVHVFYSIHREDVVPDWGTDYMLKMLAAKGEIELHYLHPDRVRSCGGNVDTLMSTMAADIRYDCFIKMDDDIVIGQWADTTLASVLMELEDQKLVMLMGQMVPQHVRREDPFSWETHYQGYHVGEQHLGTDPMETFTAVNPRLVQYMKEAGKSPLCGNPTGNFSVYSRTMITSGYHVATLLDPPVHLQHIGLTSSIRGGIRRSWAPATSWESPKQAIEVPYFDFDAWESSHPTGTQREVTLDMLAALHEVTGVEAVKWISNVLVECVSEPLELPPVEPPPVVRKRAKVEPLTIKETSQAKLIRRKPIGDTPAIRRGKRVVVRKASKARR